jgi:hypothetical protein
MIPIEYPFSVGMSSTPSTIFPLISGKGFLRFLWECVPLLLAIVASRKVLWLGACQRSRAGASRKGVIAGTAPLPSVKFKLGHYQTAGSLAHEKHYFVSGV